MTAFWDEDVKKRNMEALGFFWNVPENGNLHSYWIQIFSSSPRSLTLFKNDKAKFKEALRKQTHIHFYSADDIFRCKDGL